MKSYCQIQAINGNMGHVFCFLRKRIYGASFFSMFLLTSASPPPSPPQKKKKKIIKTLQRHRFFSKLITSAKDSNFEFWGHFLFFVIDEF